MMREGERRTATNQRLKIGVINERGELIGVFNEAAYAEAFMAGLHAEQMRKVGYVIEYATVPVDLKNCWTKNEQTKNEQT